jgi:hypothetical protein
VKTTIRHCSKGAESALGTVVIIDVFRASNTILMLLARGASSVIPVMRRLFISGMNILITCLQGSVKGSRWLVLTSGILPVRFL